jgi:hypothetical protein
MDTTTTSYETRRDPFGWTATATNGKSSGYGKGRTEAEARADADRQLAMAQRAQRVADAARARGDCAMCAVIGEIHGGMGPRHAGSARCRSGSIAAGGEKAHCTCDICF